MREMGTRYHPRQKGFGRNVVLANLHRALSFTCGNAADARWFSAQEGSVLRADDAPCSLVGAVGCMIRAVVWLSAMSLPAWAAMR